MNVNCLQLNWSLVLSGSHFFLSLASPGWHFFPHSSTPPPYWVHPYGRWSSFQHLLARLPFLSAAFWHFRPYVAAMTSRRSGGVLAHDWWLPEGRSHLACAALGGHWTCRGGGHIKRSLRQSSSDYRLEAMQGWTNQTVNSLVRFLMPLRWHVLLWSLYLLSICWPNPFWLFVIVLLVL